MLHIRPMRFVQSLFCALALMTGLAQAADPPQTPTMAPPGMTLVEADAVQKFQAAGAIIVDARKAAEFTEATIKGAVSVPYDPEMSAKAIDFDASRDKYDLSPIPDKNKTYVVFCNASACWKSFKLATVMVKEGYKNVNWYRNGFPDWKARNLPVE